MGKAALPAVAPLLAEGLLRRRNGALPVLTVACENVLGNSEYLAELVRNAAGEHAGRIAEIAAFPNCVVDRIVPDWSKFLSDHPLIVCVEEYAQWIIDATALTVTLPIAGVEYREDLHVVLAQKLCTLNMAHAIVGYYGYLRGHTCIHDAMRDCDIRALLDGAIREAGSALQATFGIPKARQEVYAAQVVHRLENPALRDPIARVARDPMRKLGAHDRLVRPAVDAVRAAVIPAHLATGIAAALAYDASGDREAGELQELIRMVVVREALRRVSGIPEDGALADLVHATVHFGALRT